MSNLTININGTDYPLATTLRVAFIVQGQHNHKSYLEVFKVVDKMTVEEQLGIVYAAFKCANPEQSAFITQGKFQDYCLDHMNLKDLMDKMQAVIKGITGEGDDEDSVPENTMAVSEGIQAPEGN